MTPVLHTVNQTRNGECEKAARASCHLKNLLRLAPWIRDTFQERNKYMPCKH